LQLKLPAANDAMLRPDDQLHLALALQQLSVVHAPVESFHPAVTRSPLALGHVIVGNHREWCGLGYPWMSNTLALSKVVYKL